MATALPDPADAAWAEAAEERLRLFAPALAERIDSVAGGWDRTRLLSGACAPAATLLASQPDLAAPLLEAEPAAASAARVSEQALLAVEAAGGISDGEPDAQRDAQASAALARTQRQGVLRIGLRDLMGLADTPQAAAELSALADGLIAAALAVVERDAAGEDAQLVVLGMGKLGGEELNYVSDVDVLFVHDGDTVRAERRARRVLRLLGAHTPLGPTYEMDANLRPEGRNGPLTRSLDSYRAYYERWAKTWEFQALLKVRPSAGPAALAEAFVDLAGPFVWPEQLGAEAVEEIQAMKRRVERSRPVARDGVRQLKLAPGGLRDIEFATQLLQLVHGPADPALRTRGTLPALRALAAGGYIDDGDAHLFADAYMFLRTLEHRLQLLQLRRTHTLPEDPKDRQRLARAAGFRDLASRSAGEQLDRELARVRGGVRRIHQRLFYRPLLATIASFAPDQRVDVSETGLDTAAVEARLRALSFASAHNARRNLEVMVSGGTRTARQLRVVLPAMLEALADEPDPDGGLAALTSLADALRDNPAFLRTIRENPPAARLLARVLGRSPRLGEWLTRQPEVLALLEEGDGLDAPLDPDGLLARADGLLRRGHTDLPTAPLRRLKRREMLRTALRDLTGRSDIEGTGKELTWLAEAMLRAATEAITPPGVRLAVIGMGRLGAAELGYSSDLDVLFVHDGPTPDAERAAERILSFLADVTPEGTAFRLDADLRPEGRSGPMTRSLDSYDTYHRRWADHWEMQALTQARPVAGDAELGAAFMRQIEPLVYEADDMPARLTAIRQMKARVEKERAGRRPPRTATGRRRGPRTDADADLKLGPGGMSDVEWTVQVLALRHGGEMPLLRIPGTMAGLEALERSEVLAAEEAAWLRSGWRLLGTLRNGLYLRGNRDTATLPSGSAERERLAALLGYPRPGTQSLLEDLRRAQRRIRKVFDRRFFG